MLVKELHKNAQKNNRSFSKALIESSEDLAARLDYFDLIELIQSMAYVIHDHKLDEALIKELKEYTKLLREKD